MRKTIFFIFALTGFSFSNYLCAQEVRFLDWGLEQYKSEVNGIVRLLVEIENNSVESEKFEISIRGPQYKDLRIARSYILVAAGATHREELPIPEHYFPSHGKIEVRKSDGASCSPVPMEFESLSNPDHLIVVLSDDNDRFNDIRNRILSSGTVGDQADKSRKTAIIRPRYPPRHWWGYGRVKAVILAKPVDSFLPQELEAIEEYACSGGHLVLIEPELHDNDFLKIHRQRMTTVSSRDFGSGKLTVLKTISDLGKDFERLDSFRGYFPGRSNLIGTNFYYLQHVFGTVYTFPHVGWLLAFLCLFLLIAGPVNFLVLHRLKKQEWGWITVPVVSLVFASAIIMIVVAKRPYYPSLDEFSYVYMDEIGNKALKSTYVRISSPVRSSIRLSLPSDVVVGEEIRKQAVSEFMESLYRFDSGHIFDIGPGSPLHCDVYNLSFAKLEFDHLTDIGGRVVQTGGSGLHNQSGISFDSAIYVLPRGLYRLDSFPAGSSRDLASVPCDPFMEGPDKNRYFNDVLINRLEDETLFSYGGFEEIRKAQPFSLTWLIERKLEANWNAYFEEHSALFMGISRDEPTVRTDNPEISKQNRTVTVIHFPKDHD